MRAFLDEIHTGIHRFSRTLSVLMWVGLTQSVEGLPSTERLSAGNSSLCLCGPAHEAFPAFRPVRTCWSLLGL